MNALAPSDPRKVKTKYELIPKPGLLGTSVRLFAERNLTRHGILDWPFNQSRPTNIANRFVESTNEAFLNLASVSLLRSVGFGVLGNYYGPLTEEDFVFAADAYVVDRLLASERAPFTATLRTLALEFAVLFARGYMSDKPGELPSAQRRIMRIVEELEVTHEIVIPDDDPFWRILCLGVVILCGDAYWNEWMKPYRELFEAFASAKQ
ncbi:MAG: hypothetical protein K8S54_03640 [Spirochaetia bacterium]|nr:hypothetical protein [Spirochaetia bacterium]